MRSSYDRRTRALACFAIVTSALGRAEACMLDVAEHMHARLEDTEAAAFSALWRALRRALRN
ncbi:MAG: hypothetical protein JNM84_13240 [Planctomycetes bacterium]|nr:hypothetical protein [Planctomycetota bacterium]